MKIIIIIPAYNEEKNILRVCKILDEHSNEFDYIVINDGSKDNTEKILTENNINHIKLIHNLGIGGAVQTGYKYAYQNGYDIAVQFDGDGQHDVKYITKICKPVIDGQADMCIGTRYLDKSSSKFQSTFMRRFGKNIISCIINLYYHKKITDPTSGFRAINKDVLKIFAENYPREYPEPESTVEILKNDYKVVEVPVSMNERQGGKSSINLWKSADYMFKVVLAILITGSKIHKYGGNK